MKIVTFSCQKDIFIYEEGCGYIPREPYLIHKTIEDAKLVKPEGEIITYESKLIFNTELKPCPTCKRNIYSKRKACHECERSYSREELDIAMYETWIATQTKAESFDGITRIVLAKLNDREV